MFSARANKLKTVSVINGKRVVHIGVYRDHSAIERIKKDVSYFAGSDFTTEKNDEYLENLSSTTLK